MVGGFSMMHRFCGAIFGVALLLFSATAPVSGQVLYGSAVGTVLDPTGGVVADAPVTMTSKTTGAVREAKTDPQGRFVLANLPPDVYDLKVAAPGFRTFTQTEIIISINNV